LFYNIFCIRIYCDYSGFSKIYVSQGSVATQLKCGGMFSTSATTLLQIFHRMCWWKKWKSINIWWRYRQKFAAYFFGPSCICI